MIFSPPNEDKTEQGNSDLSQNKRAKRTPTSNFSAKDENDIAIANTNFR